MSILSLGFIAKSLSIIFLTFLNPHVRKMNEDD